MNATLPRRQGFRIAPSILSADFLRLGEECRSVLEAGADWLHVDVMDGAFVPNISIGQPVVASLRKLEGAFLDVHLMIEQPERYIESFAAAGADLITVHVESSVHLHRTLQQIRRAGKLAGVTLNPHTDPAQLDYVLEEVDMVLVMSVNPGFGGQSFIESALRKSEWIANRAAQLGLVVDLEIDGGVRVDNIRRIADAGVNIFVAGNAVFNAPSRSAVISSMREELARQEGP